MTLVFEILAVVVGEDPAKELGTTLVKHSDATQAALRATRMRVRWKEAMVFCNSFVSATHRRLSRALLPG